MLQNTNRISLLDITRGFALFGILLVNMQSFHSPNFIDIYYGLTTSYQGFEKWLFIFFQLFIQMKFYPIFSFLFGLGFSIFISKSSRIFFVRRMMILLVFGLLHLIFLWYGDILHLYALTGLFLLAFHKLQERSLIVWAFTLLAFYHLLLGVSILLPVETLVETYEHHQNIYKIVYSEAPFIEWVIYRIKTEVLPIINQIPLTMIPVLGMFLLGLYAGKKTLYLHNIKNHGLITRWWIISLFLSIPTTLINGLILTSFFKVGAYKNGLVTFLSSLSGITLSIFYMTTLFLLLEHKKAAKFLHPLRFIGRVSLTNYLLQSIICIGLFRLFNLYGKIDLVEGTVIGVLLFSIQLLGSYLWLTSFHNGPVEWLWRSLTYGKILPFRLRKNDKDLLR